MALRRTYPLLTVFALGCILGWALVRFSNRSLSDDAARSRAVQALERKPIAYTDSPDPIVQAVKTIAPSVVNIDTTGRARTVRRDGASVYIDPEVHGKGSGVILTPDGFIVTNSHVIEGAASIRVMLSNGQWYYGRRVAADPQSDIAVIRIDASALPAAEFADSDRLEVGERSIAVGNPLGLGSTVTVGVISALNRHNLQVEEGRKLEGAIQTDAPINRGNSGGALANIHGQLIGINTAILSSGDGGGSIGLAFAIPANSVRRIARELIVNGAASSPPAHLPWLGVILKRVPEARAAAAGLGPYRGAVIGSTVRNGPAEQAHLAAGDILLEVDHKEIGRLEDVREAVEQRRVGDSIDVRILSAGTGQTVERKVVLGARPQNLNR